MANKHGYMSCLALLGLCLICLEAVEAHILVYRRETNQLMEEYNDLPAAFGPALPPNGIKVYGVDCEFACGHVDPPPKMFYPVNAKFVALVSRGGDCKFEVKVRNAQAANYFAIVVYNNEGDDLEQMSADNATGIHIPAVFVGQTTGKILLSFLTPDVVFIINDELPFNINTQLILPFSILIGLCFLIMVVYMIYKCIRERRRMRRYRLPKSMLKKITTMRYTKNNKSIKGETCVICLEDFVEDDKLRVLPCLHPYHTHCIDPWLTEIKRVCPMCKRKVFTRGETHANRIRQPSLDSVTDTDDDTTPLLQRQPNGSATAAAVGNATGNSSTATTASEATTRHGTFRRTETQQNDAAATHDSSSSDEENALLDSMSTRRQSSTSTPRRINPFDRTPNVPPHMAVLLIESQPSIWSRFSLGFLFRRPANISVAAPPFVEHVEAGLAASSSTATVALTMPTSNNILNPNLSGSFKDDDDIPPHHSIYEPIAATTPAAGNNQATSTAAAAESEFIQTPTEGGIGVAALPHSEQFLI